MPTDAIRPTITPTIPSHDDDLDGHIWWFGSCDPWALAPGGDR
jgi:hypothetical protein